MLSFVQYYISLQFKPFAVGFVSVSCSQKHLTETFSRNVSEDYSALVMWVPCDAGYKEVT